jgi:NADH-quinone oxidoreductase subunit A
LKYLKPDLWQFFLFNMVLLQLSSFYSFLIYAIAAVVVVGFMIGFSHILGERHKARFRDEPFESGMPVTGDARIRYSAHFYMVGMFFVIFDLDAVFIITYAIAYKDLGWPGYLGILVFVGLLAAVLIYEWKIGALDFGPDGKKILQAMPKNKVTKESMK